MAWLAELAAAGLFPVLYWQGKRTRARTPRLPEASGQPRGIAGNGHSGRFHLLVLGESPVAGVGVDNYQESLAAQFTQAIAEETGKQVHWRAIGKNGSKISGFLEADLPLADHEMAQPDLVLLVFGVNDTTGFTPDRLYRRHLLALKTRLEQHLRPRAWLISAVPRVGRFPALPRPLRTVLGYKAAALNRVTSDFATRYQTGFAAMPELQAGWMAKDGFHPSSAGVQRWAQELCAAWLRSAA